MTGYERPGGSWLVPRASVSVGGTNASRWRRIRNEPQETRQKVQYDLRTVQNNSDTSFRDMSDCLEYVNNDGSQLEVMMVTGWTGCQRAGKTTQGSEPALGHFVSPNLLSVQFAFSLNNARTLDTSASRTCRDSASCR